MFVELLIAGCLGQQAPPADAVPAQTPPPTPSLPPPTIDAPITTPAPPGLPGEAPLPRVATPPRRTRNAQATPGAASVPSQATAPAIAEPAMEGAAPMAARAYGADSIPPGQGVYRPGLVPTAGMGMLGGNYGYGVVAARRPVDPKETELDRKAREAAAQIQREQDPTKKAQLKAGLQALVAEQFQYRQQRRADELKRLEDEVKKLRDAVDKREKSKDAIIAKRVAELTGDDDLGF